MSDTDLSLEVLDYSWQRKAFSPNIVSAEITESLGEVGEGTVTLPLDDPAILYIPDPDAQKSVEARWRLYEGSSVVFAGVVDNTKSTINEDGTFTFGGKHRGILLGTRNVGRRDFNAWGIEELFTELRRDNIGKAPMATIISSSSEHNLHPAVNAIVGDIVEGNYWSANTSGSNFITIDLGSSQTIDAIRVIPPWWDQRWYKFTVATSTDNSTYTTRSTKSDVLPLSSKGKLVSLSSVSARYVRVTVSDSTDAVARLAAVLVLQDIADAGSDTDFVVPWIENDDSGNVTTSGTTSRVVEQGSFNGDGVIGHSFVTRLGSTGSMTHTFRGTGTSVVLTQGTAGGNASFSITLDGTSKGSFSVGSGTYQHTGYEVSNLSSGVHTLTVTRVSGTPQIDYFTGLYESAYRPIRDDDASIGYTGTWKRAENVDYRNFTAAQSSTSGSSFIFDFKGDLVKIIGTKGPSYGKMSVYIDDSLDDTIDCYKSGSNSYEQVLYTWSGTYDDHTLRGVVTGTKNASSSGSNIDIDGLEGNFGHVIYQRSFYENNLRMLTRLSEITNTWLRCNNDGSVDLLGAVGDSSGTVIREGENEGGTIINADKTLDYADTCSAVLALVTGPEDNPIKAFVIDMNAVKKMGVKVRKMEQADANDAYLLTRQAWQELKDHADPVKKFTVQYDPSEVGDITVGETTKLYSPTLSLSGTDALRIGRMTTTYSKD